MNRSSSVVAALGLVVGASAASANVEVGGTAGVHVFSETNELGVPDIKNAPSERNSALFGLRIGVTFTDIIGIEGEFGVIPSESRTMVFDIWNITYRAHLIAQFGASNPMRKLVPFVLFGGGAMQIVSTKEPDVISKDTDAELYAGIGAKYRVDNGWGLRADLRILFPPSSASNGATVDFEALLAIYKEFGRTPPPAPVEEPKGPKDTDGDGIPDSVDKCPNEPEDKDGFQDDDGCPDPDNDGDGIPDTADKCPMQPEDKDGFQDEDGCPDPDNDGDGIPDAADKCPDQPEDKDGFQDEDGCPDELPQKVKQFTGVIQGINFKTGAADLLPNSNKTLDKAVAVLQEFADLKLEIQGHTDDQPLNDPKGKYADNTALSQARAESVKAYFVGKGIADARVTAKGYADTVPVEDPKGLKGAKLNAARAKNRRVEFKLVSALTQGTALPPPPPPPPPATTPTPTPTPAPAPGAPAPGAPAAGAPAPEKK